MKILPLILIVNGVVLCSSQATDNWRLKNMVNIEQHFNNHISNTLQERFSFLQRIKSRFVKLISINSVGGTKEDYMNNPLPAFVLIRRLIEDWVSLVSMLAGNHGSFQLGLGKLRWPSTRHLESAALSVARAQWTYDLDISQMENGIVPNKPKLFNVTAADCFYIASAYKKIKFVDEALEWLNQASNRSKTDGTTISSQTMLKSLAYLRCYSGDTTGARVALAELSEIMPRLKAARIGNNDWKSFRDCSELYYNLQEMKVKDTYMDVGKSELEKHREMCSGEENLAGNLHCRYVHYHQPYLRFQPFKLEELHLDPPLLRFYDVITDKEGAILKEFSSKKMEASTTYDSSGITESTNFRTSQVSWIQPGVLDVGDRLKRRIADLTQLNVETAEALQISRYSISGEFLPHYDYFRGVTESFLDDRIASLMFYLNDVKEGGNTIFVAWNVTVKPIKNSAILWFNQFPSGEIDPTTMHSGCPVLQGTKWILIEWFLNIGHEFQKNCGRNPRDSFLNHYLH